MSAIPSYYDYLNEQIKAKEEEIKVYWNALRDINRLSHSHGEAKEIAQVAMDKYDPFAPVAAQTVTEEAKEVKVA